MKPHLPCVMVIALALGRFLGASDVSLGEADVVIQGAAASDRAYAIAGAGDIDGDGTGDIILGAARAGVAPTGGFEPGRAYLLFGGEDLSGEIDLASLGARGVEIVSGSEPGWLGYSVAGAGDVNGDGADDFIVSALRAGEGGIAYIVFGGSPLPNSLDVSTLGSRGVKVLGAPGSGLGRSVAGIGDFNGDGFDDVAIGAIEGRTVPPVGGSVGRTGRRTGMVYIILGGPDLPAEIHVDALVDRGIYVNGVEARDFFGARVSGAGDFNGDGLPDLVIGAPMADPFGRNLAGESYVVFGTHDPPPVIDIILDLDARILVRGARAGDQLGYWVAGGGDVNGDGVDDVVLTATGADPSGVSDAGAAYVIFGSTAPQNIDLSVDVGFVTIAGEAPRDAFGSSAAAIGDFSRDGIDDIVIGADTADPRGIKDAGAAWIVHGGESLPARIDVDALGEAGNELQGERPFDAAGFAVAGLGDVNGDQVPDVGVAARDASPLGRVNAGTFYVFFGPRTPAVEELVCEISAQGNRLSWRSSITYDSIRIERNGVEIATLPGDATSYLDGDLVAGVLTYRVIGVLAGVEASAATCTLSANVLPPGSLACSVESDRVVLAWAHRHPTPVDGTRIFRDGELIATVDGTVRSFIDEEAEPGPHVYRLVAFIGDAESIGVECSVTIPAPPSDLLCSVDACDVRLSWLNAEEYDAVEVRRNGELVALLETGSLESFVDREVPPGEYTYSVAGRIGDGTSAAATCEVTVLAEVTGLEGSAEGSTVSLSWDPVPIADAILVHRDSMLVAELSPDATSFEESSVEFGSRAYTVRARLGTSIGKPAEVTVEVVAPVEDLRACADGAAITLEWTAGDTYDSIEVSLDGEVVSTLAGSATSATVDAAAALEHVLLVTGIRGNGRSDPAQAIEIVLPAVLDLSAGWADDILSISWTLPAAATFDRILVFVNGEERASLSGDATSAEIEIGPIGFAAIVVRGVIDDADCPSLGIAAEISAALLDAPRDIVCSALGLDVTVEWANGAVYESVEITRNGVVVVTLAGDATRFEETLSEPGVYEYGVRGIVGGAPTLAAVCTVRILAAPADLVCENEGDRVVLSWTAAGGADGVRVFRNGEEIASLPAGATSYADEAPVVGANEYEVRFASGATLGLPAVCTATILPPLLNVMCSADGMTGQVAWEPDAAYDAVLVFRNGLAVGPAEGVPGEQGSFVEDGLAAGEHCYVLQGVTMDGGVSPPSDPCCFEVVLPPIRLMCSAEDAAVRLTWENPRAYESIEILRDGAVIATLPGGAAIYEDPEATLAPGSYEYAVRGRSGASVSAPATCVITIPEPVSDLACRQEGTTILLSWNVPAGADAITIHRNGEEIAMLPGDATSFADEGLAVNLYNYEVRTSVGSAVGSPVACAVDMIHPVRDLTCAREGADIVLGWTLGDGYDAIDIFRDGALITDPSLPGDATSFVDAGIPPGSHTYALIARRGSDESEPAMTLCIEGPTLTSCGLDGSEVVIAWEFAGEADGFIVRRTRLEDGDEESFELAADVREYREVVAAGTYEYVVTVSSGGTSADSLVCEVAISAGFIRGEVNGDARRDIADPIYLLNFLWRNGPDVTCLDAGDVNDDGFLDVSDATYFIIWQFSGGPAPPAPFPGCGEDPTADDLGCESFPLVRCP